MADDNPVLGAIFKQETKKANNNKVLELFSNNRRLKIADSDTKPVLENSFQLQC
jgi:hypothetical protein